MDIENEIFQPRALYRFSMVENIDVTDASVMHPSSTQLRTYITGFLHELATALVRS